MRNWPKESIYDPVPSPVECEDGVLFGPWQRKDAVKYAESCGNNGLTTYVYDLGGDLGIHVSISGFNHGYTFK